MFFRLSVFLLSLAPTGCALAPHLPVRDLPIGTTVKTLSDMTLTNSASEFVAFQEEWPSICGSAAGAQVCFVSYEGRFEGSSGLRPSRDALVSLPGNYVCNFKAGQPGRDSGWLVFRSQYRDGTFAGPGGPLNPIPLEVAPDAAAFVDLCRKLRTA